MKTKNAFKTLAIAAVFGLSYVGFTFSNATERIAGVETTVTMISLSTQAKACTEVWEGWGIGYCNNFDRCAYTMGPGNCYF
ncbi:MAG: hypothetical protein Q8S11_02050 [Daejeonella sp.]|uniref:hypothetical protein n=1 Tax=Daejeonella sp. TaxID=2805397 RepID=UPI00273548E9|nr:hypothetical protein [Daejeonella sp.]MDP3467086.1 hypothetical protein [Daejeonella sp.]